MPQIVILAGPNGAGKSTAAPALLRGALRVREFVNADVIAQGLSGFNPDAAAVQAGRAMLERLDSLAAKRVDFAFEATLASRGLARRIRMLGDTAGYRCSLVFLWLTSPEAAIQRVAARVRLGGHDVPEATIRRRYHAAPRNFFTIYRPLTEMWRFYDNSGDGPPVLVAAGTGSETDRIARPDLWRAIEEAYAG